MCRVSLSHVHHACALATESSFRPVRYRLEGCLPSFLQSRPVLHICRLYAGSCSSIVQLSRCSCCSGVSLFDKLAHQSCQRRSGAVATQFPTYLFATVAEFLSSGSILDHAVRSYVRVSLTRLSGRYCSTIHSTLTKATRPHSGEPRD